MTVKMSAHGCVSCPACDDWHCPLCSPCKRATKSVVPSPFSPCGCGLDHHAAAGSPYVPQPPLTEERIRQIVCEEMKAALADHFAGRG